MESAGSPPPLESILPHHPWAGERHQHLAWAQMAQGRAGQGQCSLLSICGALSLSSSANAPWGWGQRTTVASTPFCLPQYSPGCELLEAEESESWVLQGCSQPLKLRACRPRHRSLALGRPWALGEDVGKSILLAAVSSTSSSSGGREQDLS